LKEVGVGFATRLVAKNVKPQLTISESGGKWTLRAETGIKTITTDFTPGVEFDETTADGRDQKVCVLKTYKWSISSLEGLKCGYEI